MFCCDSGCIALTAHLSWVLLSSFGRGGSEKILWFKICLIKFLVKLLECF